jgi:hypothetical protein
VLDTTIVDLHRVSAQPLRVSAIEGGAFVVGESEEGEQHIARLELGGALKVGDTIFVDPGSRVEVAGLSLTGGRRGRAHSFVAQDAFKASPGVEDVPRLLSELAQIERQIVAQTGEDPLAAQRGPVTPFERAMSADFALQNLEVEIARALPEAIAKREGAVALFLSGDGAHVAVQQISLKRLRALMEALSRPVTPHMVTEDTLTALLHLTYPAGSGM